MGREDKPEGRQQSGRWAVAAVTLAVNLGSFLFLVLVARSAAPAVFGALGALAALTLVFEVPANALQVAVGRTVSATNTGGRVPPVAAGPLVVEASAFGAGVCAVLLALSPLVEHFLHLPSITSALLLGAYALPVGMSVVPKGVLAGQGRWPLLSTGLLAGMAVRLVVGVALVRRGGGLEGAFVAMVWGELVTAVIVLIGLRRLLGHPDGGAPAELVVPPARHLVSPAVGPSQGCRCGLHGLLGTDRHRHRAGPPLARAPLPRAGTRRQPRWPR